MVAQQLISSGGQLHISEVSFEHDQRVVAGGCSDVPQTDAPVGGVNYERDRRGSASDECGNVSFEHDRGRVPIVMDGCRVCQMVAQQLISSGGQLCISKVSFECD